MTGGQEVRIDVEVPRGIALAVRSTSGDVASEGLPGPQQIDTTSGDIQLDAAAGPVRIGTTSGDVEARDVGRLTLRTVSGDLEVNAARGVLEAHSTSGDLTVRDAADSVVLGTVTGDMEVSGAARGLVASTTSGDVVVRSARGRVDVSASSGRVPAAGLLVAVDLVAPLVPAVAALAGKQLEVRAFAALLDDPVDRRRLPGVPEEALRRLTAPATLANAQPPPRCSEESLFGAVCYRVCSQ